MKAVSADNVMALLDQRLAATRARSGTAVDIGVAFTDALNNDIAIMEALRTLLALLRPSSPR